MKTKWIAWIVSVCLCLSSVAFAAEFKDVGEAHSWAKAEIENYAERGILAGDGTGNFLPDDNVTRAEFAKMLCLVFNLSAEAKLGYTDVDKNSWQYEYVAKTNAFVYTDNGEIYAPDAAATRAELAYAIVNAAGFGHFGTAGRTELGVAAKRRKFQGTTMSATIHCTTKRRIATVNHLVDIFHFDITGMKSILNYFIVISENLL